MTVNQKPRFARVRPGSRTATGQGSLTGAGSWDEPLPEVNGHCDDREVRIDPDPDGSELALLGQYLDYQRETMLPKIRGLASAQRTAPHRGD